MCPYFLAVPKIIPRGQGIIVESFCGRSIVNCRTLNEPYSFMGVDLGVNRFLLPSCYTIRNRMSSSYVMLNWLLEGSINSEKWYILDKRLYQTEDLQYNAMVEEERKILKTRGGSSTWSVDKK